MRDFDPTASEFITSGYLEKSVPGGLLYDAGVIMGGAQLLGGLLGSDAASSAAETQAGASRYAADIQKQMFDKQIELQKPSLDAGNLARNRLLYYLGLSPTGTTNTGAGQKTLAQFQNELSPQFTTPGNAGGWVQSGTDQQQWVNGSPYSVDQAGLNAAAQKAYDAQGAQTQTDAAALAAAQADPSYGSMSKNFTAQDFAKGVDPGYQFRMDEGMKGVNNSAAARGGLLSGAALKAMQKYGQDYASGEYQNAYNRFNNDNTTQYNRLAGLAGSGQQAATTMGQAAGNYGNNAANLITGGANALAAGQVGSANAWNNALSQGINGYQQNQLMSLIGGRGGFGGGGSTLGGNMGNAANQWTLN